MEKKDATTLRDGRSHSENGTIGLTRNENGKYLIGDRFSLLTKEGLEGELKWLDSVSSRAEAGTK
jgi:hypothetical protein